METYLQIIIACVFLFVFIVLIGFAFWLALGDCDDFIYRCKARKYYRIKNRVKRLQNHLTYLENFYFRGKF